MSIPAGLACSYVARKISRRLRKKKHGVELRVNSPSSIRVALDGLVLKQGNDGEFVPWSEIDSFTVRRERLLVLRRHGLPELEPELHEESAYRAQAPNVRVLEEVARNPHTAIGLRNRALSALRERGHAAVAEEVLSECADPQLAVET